MTAIASAQQPVPPAPVPQQNAPAQTQPAPVQEAAPAAQQNAGQQDANVQAAESAEQQGRVGRVQDLIGMPIVGQNGQPFGTVDDLMVDKRTGQIAYALVAQDKNSPTLYPVPWRAVAWTQDNQGQFLAIAIKPEQIQQAPTVARQQWPTMTYTQWNTVAPRVTTFYAPIVPGEARAIRRTARAMRQGYY